jgi:hypothetical protein
VALGLILIAAGLALVLLAVGLVRESASSDAKPGMTMRSASGSGARHAARRVIRRTSRAYAAEGSRGSSGTKRAKRWNWPTARAIRKQRLQ